VVNGFRVVDVASATGAVSPTTPPPSGSMPDLVVSSIAVQPSPVQAGDTLTQIAITTKNKGGVATANHSMRFTITNTRTNRTVCLGGTGYVGLDAGQAITRQFASSCPSITVANGDAFVIRATVDANMVIAESDEQNNTNEFMISVGGSTNPNPTVTHTPTPNPSLTTAPTIAPTDTPTPTGPVDNTVTEFCTIGATSLDNQGLTAETPVEVTPILEKVLLKIFDIQVPSGAEILGLNYAVIPPNNGRVGLTETSDAADSNRDTRIYALNDGVVSSSSEVVAEVVTRLSDGTVGTCDVRRHFIRKNCAVFEGDANCDGTVTVEDRSVLLQSYADTQVLIEEVLQTKTGQEQIAELNILHGLQSDTVQVLQIQQSVLGQ
jgi:hypothetical protein